MSVLKEKSDIINHCASVNDENFNRNKILEEVAEFQEVAVKLATKSNSNPKRPDKEELIKEFGDVVYRGIIYLRQQFPELSLEQLLGKIDDRIDKKLSNLERYKKENLYKTGL